MSRTFSIFPPLSSRSPKSWASPHLAVIVVQHERRLHDTFWFGGYWRGGCTLPCCVVPIKDETDSEWDPEVTDLDTDSDSSTTDID